jgi:hypothetical protein
MSNDRQPLDDVSLVPVQPVPAPPSEGDLDDMIDAAKALDPTEQLRLIADLWASMSPSLRAELRDSELPALLERLRIAHPRAKKVYSAPRRFDLATIFVVTFAYSLLFGVMKALSFPPMASITIAGFISLVGAGQAFLFGGQQPRTASLVVGAVIYSIGMIAAWLVNGPRTYPTPVILIGASYSVIGGAILGYLSGTFVGGVFLIADKLRLRFSRKPANETSRPDGGSPTFDDLR